MIRRFPSNRVVWIAERRPRWRSVLDQVEELKPPYVHSSFMKTLTSLQKPPKVTMTKGGDGYVNEECFWAEGHPQVSASVVVPVILFDPSATSGFGYVVVDDVDYVVVTASC
jgi:hypothetical protein